jgi:hypothetical protein
MIEIIWAVAGALCLILVYLVAGLLRRGKDDDDDDDDWIDRQW